ncbi:MAG: MmcQ/YjbR family DNA-binding protein [Eubacteriales bacterium]|nr:MmcQ/YjbR family DNA-binding protein [Eubacteriales bacterium]
MLYFETAGSLRQVQGFLPGYHMNKNNWISILLDGTVGEIKILDFLDRSYELIESRAGK